MWAASTWRATRAAKRPCGGLRARKHRPEKPLAVLCADAEEARAFCRVGEAERALLESPRRPIVLLDKLDPAAFPALSANDRLGVMLPGTPLHVLLTDGTAGGPRSVVCTSANVPGCPVILENGEALRALANVADCFLVHNREIVNRCDEFARAAVARRGRLFAAQPRLRRRSPWSCPFPRRASGPSARSRRRRSRWAGGRRAFLSPHIGDLKNAETLEHYRAAHAAYTRLFPLTPRRLVCDLHPDYLSTREAEAMARETGLPLLRVQHHWAHFAACLADNGVPAQSGPFFGLVWDGTGLGPDGTVWGCEFLRGGYGGWGTGRLAAPHPAAGRRRLRAGNGPHGRSRSRWRRASCRTRCSPIGRSARRCCSCSRRAGDPPPAHRPAAQDACSTASIR